MSSSNSTQIEVGGTVSPLSSTTNGALERIRLASASHRRCSFIAWSIRAIAASTYNTSRHGSALCVS